MFRVEDLVEEEEEEEEEEVRPSARNLFCFKFPLQVFNLIFSIFSV